MTRVVNGIFSDAQLETGYFITDKQADLICEWLTSYANALEKAWVNKGSEGDARKQKFTKVRSFAEAVKRGREEDGISSSATTTNTNT